MTDLNLTDEDLMKRLTQTLSTVPDVVVQGIKHISHTAKKGHVGQAHQVEATIQIASRPLVLLIIIRQIVFPRDVQGLIWKLLAASPDKSIDTTESSNGMRTNSRGLEVTNSTVNSSPKKGGSPYPVPVLVARSISVNARELLRQQRIGYFDAGGSLYIQAPDAYVLLDNPVPKAISRVDAVPSRLFTDKRAEVVHALLANHERWLGVNELAKMTMASPATISQVLTALDRLGWVETQGQGRSKKRRLQEPGALLDAWAKQATHDRRPALRRYYIPALDTGKLVTQVAKVFHAHGIAYAVTHEVAAQRHTPHLTSLSQVRVRTATGLKLEAALTELRAQPVSEGANLVITETRSPTELQFRDQVDGVWLASPIQIYLDLMRSEGRAKELAQHFRRERIGF